MARLAPQTAAAAFLARLAAEVLGEFLAHRVGISLAVAALHVRDHALEGMLALVNTAALAVVAETDLLLVAAVQDHVTNFFRQVFE